MAVRSAWVVGGLIAAGLVAAGLAWAWPALRPVAPVVAARAAYARGEWSSASEAARQALRERPDDAEALRLLARASMRLGRVELAQGLYDRMGMDAMRAEDFDLLAGSLVRVGGIEGAVNLLERGLEGEPEHAGSLDRLARLYAATDRLAEAAALADRLRAQPGWAARGWLLLGLIREAQAEPAAAVAAFVEALRLDPALRDASLAPDDARKRLARGYLALKQPDEALAALRSALDAGDPEASWLASRAHLQRGQLDDAVSALQAAGAFGDDRPMAHEPSPFVGAARCAACHRDIYDAQQGSHHAATFHVGAGLARMPLPDGPVPDRHAPDVKHTVRREGEQLVFETTRDARSARALIAYAFGSDDRGTTPVGRDDAGTWREARLSHYGDSAVWDVTTGHVAEPPGADSGDPHAYLGRPLSADVLRRCIDCHTTDVPSARDQAGPASADRGIGCERCHGPGGNHVLAMNAAPKFADVAIARPRLADGDQINALCARCHSPRNAEAKPGDPTSIRFQGTTLTWSRCTTASRGALSCLSCHDPHRDAETSHAYYESKCLACHDPTRTNADVLAEHPATDGTRPIALPDDVPRVPCPVNPSSGCIDCHMPTRSGVIPHTRFTDHWIRRAS
jgi:tetratricopeptide (TPR) repeat protein